MVRVRCSSPTKNPENDPNKTGCTAPGGVFEFRDPRYKNARPAGEDERGAYSVIAICSYCGFRNLIWLKGGPTDIVYHTISDRLGGR